MKEAIKQYLQEPKQLERLYRENKSQFKKDFDDLYPELKDFTGAQFWHERLHHDSDELSWGTRNEIIIVLLTSFAAGLMAKIPAFFSIDEEFFYPRNLGFILFPSLTIYFGWKVKLPIKKLILTLGVMLGFMVYINLLPNDPTSDTLILACIHLPLFLWSLFGFSFVSYDWNNLHKRLEFLRYNGDLLVITTLILISGGLLSAITFGLFELIGLRIEEFYFENIAIWGLTAVPVVGTFLILTNPQLVNKVSPVIAKVFTPLVLIMLVAYLSAILITGKDPYHDREFLLLFNLLLVGVMAIIFFSIAENSRSTSSKLTVITLLLLSICTILINGIALSAILFRITEWGITPNRLAVLGGNILILIHLITVTLGITQCLIKNKLLENVQMIIVRYLPIYSIWTFVVIMLFPLLFAFK